MRILLPLLFAGASLTACGDVTPADPVIVNDMVTGPPAAPPLARGEPVEAFDASALQPITFADIEAANLFGAGCSFHRAGEEAPILLMQPDRGAVKLDGQLVALAPDASAALLEVDARSMYKGGGTTYRIERGDTPGKQRGIETVAWPATLTVEPTALASATLAGELQCGS